MNARLAVAAAALALVGLVGANAWSRLHQAAQTGLAPLGDRAGCERYGGLPEQWGKDPHAGMVRIEGGTFQLGSERGYAEERPLAQTSVKSFWIDRTEVTNAQFATFVAATGYLSDAEHGSGVAVFHSPDALAGVPREGSWWHLDQQANWRHPDGAESNIDGRAHEPVVGVTYADATAYAHWLGRELPSEAQWEFAAKAGRGNRTADLSLRDEQGRPQANFWQGLFPLNDKAEDGYAGRAPVGCFASNPLGLHDMVGNVWEWTTDLYASRGDAVDQPSPHGSALRRVIKGGSFLCADNYCVRARASSRQGQEADLAAVHLGFRTVSAQ